MDKLLQEYIIKWQLHVAGGIKVSSRNFVLPVIYNSQPAVLKIAREGNEDISAAYYNYVGGQGAAQIYLHENSAILIERLDAKPALKDLPEEGQDNLACNIIAKVIKDLHRASGERPQNLPTLKSKFKPLLESGNNILAKELLENPLNEVVLHGDITHENIMNSGRGWLAIDPKPVLGEAAYEVAAALCHPNTVPHLVHDAKRMSFCADIYAKELRQDKKRLLQFACVYSELMALQAADDADEMAYWSKCAEVAAGLV